MKIFIDFEATEKGEIIAVGAKTADKEYYSLVKPQFSELTPAIQKLTHITKEELERANTLDIVLCDLDMWLDAQDKVIYRWEFYSYGNADIDFLRKSLKNCNSTTSYLLACQMIATMQDFSVETKEFFKQNVKLQHVYNFTKRIEKTQQHNALEDAKMLREVAKYMERNKPFETSPFINEVFAEQKKPNFIYPKGEFTAAYPSGVVICSPRPMKDLVKWLLAHDMFVNIPTDSRPKPNRVANRIMKAVKEGNTYAGYRWIQIK